MVESATLLMWYTGLNPYRGFESPPLRHEPERVHTHPERPSRSFFLFCRPVRFMASHVPERSEWFVAAHSGPSSLRCAFACVRRSVRGTAEDVLVRAPHRREPHLRAHDEGCLRPGLAWGNGLRGKVNSHCSHDSNEPCTLRDYRGGMKSHHATGSCSTSNPATVFTRRVLPLCTYVRWRMSRISSFTMRHPILPYVPIIAPKFPYE
ncbi:MAG: hypothetical protein Greene041619_221 [Candidatus Peregrinibacteria bacterium Greene0416_19]|nr:MAG: hypothetical protein Greene041619_221 [Candidatus Peregrinibacteria bacterium Greene0416_19]